MEASRPARQTAHPLTPALGLSQGRGDNHEDEQMRTNDEGVENLWSLRDWFAGQALSGLLAYPGGNPGGTFEEIAATFAANAYVYADAMLAARGEA